MRKNISDIAEEDYDVFSNRVSRNKATEDRRRTKKWIRCKEATVIYSIGRTKLTALAKEAGAVLKIDGTMLIDSEKFDRYIETFRL